VVVTGQQFRKEPLVLTWFCRSAAEVPLKLSPHDVPAGDRPDMDRVTGSPRIGTGMRSHASANHGVRLPSSPLRSTAFAKWAGHIVLFGQAVRPLTPGSGAARSHCCRRWATASPCGACAQRNAP
jgi:hypothetical protein